MDKEITDGLKEDLEKVLCDNFVCMERGEYGRCYLDNGNVTYKFCPIYEVFQEYSKKQRRQTPQ